MLRLISRKFPKPYLGHCNLPKSQELKVLQLVMVEVAGHVDAFTPDDDDFVAVKVELGDDGSQTATVEVVGHVDAFTPDDDDDDFVAFQDNQMATDVDTG